MCAAIMTISTVSADAQEAEKEPAAIVEIGSAGEWTINGNGAGHGPSFAVETTPIEHWLEIEGGVTPLFSRGRIEWDMDLLFKKPFTLSPTVEFMIGAGPSWSHTVAHGRSYNTLGAEVALDFMFWPWQGRKIGWYLEPSYGYSFSASHERTLGASAGILIPIH
ncbi:hypothetical protein ASG87_03875 [Frateuria sp. Soil773]|nr:hypothetical protein ASG87_03875 [Frateuria sp. Soil773]